VIALNITQYAEAVKLPPTGSRGKSRAELRRDDKAEARASRR